MSARSQVMSPEQDAGRRGSALLDSDRQSEPVYQDDSARRLRLTLVEGELEGAELRVLARAEQRFGAHIRVAAAIIGSSHVIRYAVGACVWHEVFACVPLNCRAAAAVYCPGGHAHQAGRANTGCPDALHLLCHPYRLVGRCSRATPAGTAGQGRGRAGLVYQFPTTPHLNDPPQTIVSARHADPQSAVIVETAHSYPNEGAIVLTRADTCRAAVGESL